MVEFAARARVSCLDGLLAGYHAGRRTDRVAAGVVVTSAKVAGTRGRVDRDEARRGLIELGQLQLHASLDAGDEALEDVKRRGDADLAPMDSAPPVTSTRMRPVSQTCGGSRPAMEGSGLERCCARDVSPGVLVL